MRSVARDEQPKGEGGLQPEIPHKHHEPPVRLGLGLGRDDADVGGGEVHPNQHCIANHLALSGVYLPSAEGTERSHMLEPSPAPGSYPCFSPSTFVQLF